MAKPHSSKAESSKDVVEDMSSENESHIEKPEKKRKRDTTQASELEIDISLPEPQSKKALRKAKKLKVSAPGDANEAGEQNGQVDTEAAEAQTAVSAAPLRSEHSIWIGNLPFIITKPLLITFLTTSSEPRISETSITRVHLPVPTGPSNFRGPQKPQNKGFAYVDFADQESFVSALALTESPLGGRRVLIKDAKNFEGRPSDHKKSATTAEGEVDGTGASSRTAQAISGNQKARKPTKRIFVGNLSFDTTKEDLEKHYASCGQIEDIHMATFEDSGKCKGFAWVRFSTEEAAQSAVQGWTKIANKDDEAEDEDEEVNAGPEHAEEGEEYITTKSGKQRRKKKRMMKWFVNRMFGRELRCEFAEDASTRYKKRFGKESRDSQEDSGNGEDRKNNRPREERVKPKRENKGTFDINPGEGNDAARRRSRKENVKQSGSAWSADGAGAARHRTGAIVEHTGKKITFE